MNCCDLFPQMSVPALQISSVSSDSRCVQPGGLFLAFPGLTVDGRQYIQSAIERGAIAIAYEAGDDYQPPANDQVEFIAVHQLQSHVGEIAARFYAEPSKHMHMVGVTGTNGKTSITQFIAQAMQYAGQQCAVIGTLGVGFPGAIESQNMTTPDPVVLQQQLARLRQQGATTIAMEVSSHSLAQNRVAGIEFDVAVFSQLSRDHLDYHGDMQTYANEKKKLFAWPSVKTCITNYDDSVGREIAQLHAQDKHVIVYTTQQNITTEYATISVSSIEAHTSGFVVHVNSPWGEGKLSTNLLGRFNVSNLLAALAVLCDGGMPLSDALQCLSQVSTVTGRMQAYGSDLTPTVVVDYAHTPDALQHALQAIREHCSGKLWCVFGCGGDRDKGKRSMMASIAEQFSDYVVVTNDNPRSESPQQIADEIFAGFAHPNVVIRQLDRAAAIQYAVQSAAVHDMVLIAGKGHEDYQLIEGKVLEFDDAQHVQKQLEDYRG